MNIGRRITVIASQNPQLIGITGKVIDETKHTLKLDNGKTLIKEHIIIEETT